jgi:hypothetical protein
MELVQRLNSFAWNVFRMIFDVDEEAIHVILKVLVKSWLGLGSMGFAFGGGTGASKIRLCMKVLSHP